jgi:ribosomal protein S18 acetylase RimI-like enzyme
MPLAIVIPQTAALQEAGLRFLYSRLPSAERGAQIESTLAAVERQELSLENLCLAVNAEQILGAVLAVRRPGGAAFLWPPLVRDCDGVSAAAVARELLETIGRRMDNQHVVFTQCLLDPADAQGSAVLDQGGVPRITDLILLSRSLRTNTVAAPMAELSAEIYTTERENRFARIVELTYAGTLDCPVLAQNRTGEESLESHRATGRFDPEAWRIYRFQGRDVGVLLLAEHPERNTWEVAYLGVVHEHRGCGFGRAILQDGLRLAGRSGSSDIEIAVDAGNAPALALYRSLGFAELRRFAVHLRLRGNQNRQVLHSGPLNRV